MSKTKNHSSYWMDAEMWDQDDDILATEKTSTEVSVERIMRLAATRRAVANFVNILTGRNDIDVRFSTGKQSYTTGDVVVISADDKVENFDSMVGLALHESAHILLSDFSFLSRVNNLTQQITSRGIDSHWGNLDVCNFSINEKITTPSHRILHPALVQLLPQLPHIASYNTSNTPEETIYRFRANRFLKDLMDIMNILEDRRIDAYVYQNAGGYRPYYDSLYERYFLNKDIGNSLKWNPNWRSLTVDNYINRLLFLIHPDSHPDAMPGLRKLIDIMDLKNIHRVAPKNTDWMTNVEYEACPTLWKVANELYVHILRFVALGQQDNPENPSQPEEYIPADEVMSATNGLPNLDMPDTKLTPAETEPAEKTKAGKDKQIRYNEKRAEKALGVAKDVVNGTLKKKKLKAKEAESIDAIEKADAKMVDISGDGIPSGECMVTRKMSEKLINEPWFIFGYESYWSRENRLKSIAAGRRMGAILEHRLQVRNDPVYTKYTRLPKGNIDRRLLANLGMDITAVFNQTKIDTFKPAMLHLTLDASGSMGGMKWEKVVTVATALAYLGSKLRNVDVVISVRGGDKIPIVSIIFDSRRDKFAQWARWIQKIHSSGATPEGLCFKATQELILECTNTHDVYFINFSDGEPSFTLSPSKGRSHSRCSYYGELAINHTRAQIRNLKENGVKVLSYFITERQHENYSLQSFRKMYGEDAVAVNVQNAHEVLRTLNKLLLGRG